MKRGIVLLNGAPYEGKIDDRNAMVYCCDGAYRWAKGKVRIDKNLGDYDSLNEIPDPPPEEVFPTEKNFTDGEAAVRRLLDSGVTDIEIYGAFGGRCDHFVGNLHLLYLCAKQGVRACLIEKSQKIFAANGGFTFKNCLNKTVSVMPFGEPLHILYSEGLKYAYPETLSYGECRGISNIVLTPDAKVLWREGEIALIFVNEGV
jgi:thiamine pyrophosphokinase